MAIQSYGLHVNAQNPGDGKAWENCVEYHAIAKPDATLLMDDNERYEKVRQIHSVTPNTIIVHRHERDNENLPSVKADKEAARAWMRDAVKDNPPLDLMWIGYFNEPEHSQYTLDMSMALMQVAPEFGVRLCGPGFSQGSWYKGKGGEAVLLDTYYDEWLHCASEHREMHIVRLHAYMKGHIAYDTAGGYKEVIGDAPRNTNHLLDPNLIQMNRWTTVREFNDLWMGNFHIGRELWFNKRCDLLGIPRVNWLDGEFGFDDVDEFPAANEMDRRNGEVLEGLRTLIGKGYWNWIFAGVDHFDIAYEMFRRVRDLYASVPECLGLILFNYGNHPQWRDRFDLSIYADFLKNRLARLRTTMPPQTPPPVVNPPVPPATPPDWKSSLTAKEKELLTLLTGPGAAGLTSLIQKMNNALKK